MLKNTETFVEIDPDSHGTQEKTSNKIADLIVEQRKRAGLSRRELAKRVGCCYLVLDRIEHSLSMPSAQIIVKISKILGISPDPLFNVSRKEKIQAYIKKNKDLFLNYQKNPSTKVPYVIFSNERIVRDFATPPIKFQGAKKIWAREGVFGKIKTKEFGTIISDYRKSRNLSLSEVSEKIGMKPAYLSRIEHGQDPPSLPVIFKLSDILGVDAWSLFHKLILERVQQYDKVSCNEYKFLTTNDPDCIMKKRHSKEGKFLKRHQKRKTLTADALILLRKTIDASMNQLSDRIGIDSTVIASLENGISLLSFKNIMIFADFFKIDEDSLFEITIKDRTKKYIDDHRQGLKNFYNPESKDPASYLRFSGEGDAEIRKEMSPFFPRSSSYIKKNRIKRKIYISQMIEKLCIDEEGALYRIWERGKFPIGIFGVIGCSDIFGTDKNKLMELVIQDKVEAYSFLYRKSWERYKEERRK
jgi:transcriptional regulator with XRE-family HTH domain